MKKAISILLSAATLSGSLCFNALAADNSETDLAYSEAAALLSAIRVLPEGEDRSEGSFITRGEFADTILKFIGISSSELAGSDIVDGKYVGYADRAPEADSWVWIDESQAQQATAGFTPYYDVSSEHKYWDSINTASQLGLMNGDTDRNFRPDERITSNEVIKVLVTIVGASELSGGIYPSGYVSQAVSLGISDSLKTKDFSSFVTYRDLAVMLFNTLESDTYEVAWEKGQRKLELSDEPYMESVLKLYKEKGVVTNNRFTGADGEATDLEGRIKVNGIYFDAPELSADDYLGYNVSVYYYSDGFEDEVVCINESEKNRVLEIDSDDITSYKKPNLYYNSEKGGKNVYLGSDTAIIYNGKLLDEYKESDLTPTNGSIKLVDNNGDNKYEYAFIDSIKTMYVSGTDVSNLIIYDKLKKGNNVKLDGTDYIIKDHEGNDAAFEAIISNEVIDVRQSVNSKGTKLIQIDISASTVKGKVTNLALGEKKMSINGNEYSISPYADLGNIKAGDEGTFYLDTKNKVVYKSTTVGLRYGYLVKLLGSEDDDYYAVKMYEFGDEVERHEFADRVKIDGSLLKKVDAYKFLAKQTDPKFISGVVKYDLDENGKLSVLMFPDNNGDDFVTFDFRPSQSEVQYRDTNKSYNLKDKTLCYRDSDTVYMNAPLTDPTEEDAYFTISYSGDDYLQYHKVYADKKDSKLAKVIVYQRDVAGVKSVGNNEILYMLKSRTEALDKSKEVITVLTGVNSNGTKNIEVSDPEIIDKMKDLDVGDLFRVYCNVSTKRVQAYEKVFDADDRCFITGKNPTGSNPTLFVSSQYHALHGMAYKKYDNDVYLDVAPYKYTVDGEVIKVGEADETNLYPYKAQDFTVVVYDKNLKNEEVKVGSHMTDIFASDVVGNDEASEVVVNSWWGSPRTIFVFK